MRSFTRRTMVGSGLATAIYVSPFLRTVEAQSYPQRPVKIIVPYAAGGASDIIARLISPEMERALGQPVIVDNRGGGASMVGTQAVATASPDGHTIGVIDSAFVINPGLFRTKLPYNTKKDFAPISLLATSPLVLVVHPSVPANSLREFVALAKAQPGKINFASAGLGTAIHLAGEQLRQAAEIDIFHVPYRGGGPAITDLIGGQVQMTFATVAAIGQQVRQGLVRGLAITGSARIAQLPDVPTMAEAGLPAADATPIFGMVGPAALPPRIIDKLAEVAGRTFKDETLRLRTTELGFVSVGSSPSEFATRIDEEIAKWTRIVEKGNIQPG
ncbi:tripartite tricarboxylate transporter substrate binding protein [Bradyrhizobium sp. 147]|uniref:Bug family tripartite tricarboxylate transporter substrate binding protein n=1 Tax=unclassified Bradyrhizobium TaxID=2631580 RepID=UPI001FF72887|nr:MULTISPECIES: tripartite tricarboxylate transporter substrate binding protein [unclassified Bradyrhizobium]MCK1546525.1 tripartite tricarboxylate transporter substrate binding protein [Bradyrhizobium sp. 179]MCK1624256.1 tripartite tricarboxylate transporter substrate binding protein [Bradyrhizobium sp. 160]MCK1678895.1 tripartite tricarboxylate transporter substrate binding protein [Bradyrhizobium sp. 147]